MGQPDIVQKRIEQEFADREKARNGRVRQLIDIYIAKTYDDSKLVQKDLTSGEIERNEEVRAVKTLLSQGVVGQIKLKQMNAELHPGELEGVFERVKAFLTQKEITDFREALQPADDSTVNFSDDNSPGMQTRDEFPHAHGQGGDYGRNAKPIDEPEGGFYDSSGSYSSNKYSRQPTSQVSGRNIADRSRGSTTADARVQTYGQHASIEPYKPADSRRIRRSYGPDPARKRIQEEMSRKSNGKIDPRAKFETGLILADEALSKETRTDKHTSNLLYREHLSEPVRKSLLFKTRDRRDEGLTS